MVAEACSATTWPGTRCGSILSAGLFGQGGEHSAVRPSCDSRGRLRAARRVRAWRSSGHLPGIEVVARQVNGVDVVAVAQLEPAEDEPPGPSSSVTRLGGGAGRAPRLGRRPSRLRPTLLGPPSAGRRWRRTNCPAQRISSACRRGPRGGPRPAVRRLTGRDRPPHALPHCPKGSPSANGASPYPATAPTTRSGLLVMISLISSQRGSQAGS